MKVLLELLDTEVEAAFESAGYDRSYGRVKVSDRPDLCEYQCNGALAAAKKYGKAPIKIAEDVKKYLSSSKMFSAVDVVKPGFLNLNVAMSLLGEYADWMSKDDHLSVNPAAIPKKIIIDYGGPNAAKPLHVGHLRSAIIGESLKRMGRILGHEVVGDVHLGDWGLQMGLIIAQMKHDNPDWPYFQDDSGSDSKEALFTIDELEKIYPLASARAKEDEEFKREAMEATHLLQQGHEGYRRLWESIIDVSVSDLKKNYKSLMVDFDLWKGESDAQKYIPDMVKRLKDEGYARMDQGALVVDVAKDTDTREVPPCMILKSDGASLYNTTDLATLVERKKLYNPDHIIYVVDKRQELYFTQVFRCARKAHIVDDDTKLTFVGFGTMNGKDGKPFKTRAGGVMRLENLISDINEKMYEKIAENGGIKSDDAKKTAQAVGISAIKYGDLSNQVSKDYVFDVDRFTSFEGNTGPYILYTCVRIKSILQKYKDEIGDPLECKISVSKSENAPDREILLEIARFGGVIEDAFEELAPHKICSYIYSLANAFNRFYHENKILTEKDKIRQGHFVRILILTQNIIELCAFALGFEIPDRM